MKIVLWFAIGFGLSLNLCYLVGAADPLIMFPLNMCTIAVLGACVVSDV